MKKTLNTVNLIETMAGTINQIIAFPDTQEGNQQVERFVMKLLKEQNDADAYDDVIEDGYYNDYNGYELAITHSNPHSYIDHAPVKNWFNTWGKHYLKFYAKYLLAILMFIAGLACIGLACNYPWPAVIVTTFLIIPGSMAIYDWSGRKDKARLEEKYSLMNKNKL